VQPGEGDDDVALVLAVAETAGVVPLVPEAVGIGVVGDLEVIDAKLGYQAELIARAAVVDQGGRDERTYLTVSFMFPGAKGDPLELVVMTDVPSCAFGTPVGVEQIRFPYPWGGFQFLDSLLGGLPGMPGYFGTVEAIAAGWLVCFSLWTHSYLRSGVAGEDLSGDG
jgi:hypothetical protein